MRAKSHPVENRPAEGFDAFAGMIFKAPTRG